MYNPIGLNVVRQSLKWMGCPKPITMSQPAPTIASPTGTVMVQICLMFDRSSLLQWALWADDMGDLTNDGIIRCALQDCFCGDLAVQPIAHKSGERLQAVVLLASLTARD